MVRDILSLTNVPILPLLPFLFFFTPASSGARIFLVLGEEYFTRSRSEAKPTRRKRRSTVRSKSGERGEECVTGPGGVLIGDEGEQVADAVEPRAALRISVHHVPERLFDVGVGKHLVFRH